MTLRSTSGMLRTARRRDPFMAAGLGALVAAVLAGAAAIWLGEHGEEIGKVSDGSIWMLCGGLLAAYLLPRFCRPAPRPPFQDMLLLSSPVIAAAMVAFPFFSAWWEAYTKDGTRLPLPIMVIASLLLVALSRMAFTARAIRRDLDPELAADDAIDADAMASSESPPAHSRRWYHWALAGLAACAPAAAVALVIAVVGAALPSPTLTVRPQQQVADAVAPGSLPDMPSAFPSQAAWSTSIVTDAHTLAITAGLRGPILMTDNGLMALDGEDGSTLWTYRVPHAHYVEGRTVETSRSSRTPFLLVSSPDRRHVAFGVYPPDERFERAPTWLAIILDTMTGEVTAQHPSPEYPEDDTDNPFPWFSSTVLQLTDSAALVGTDVIDLDGGALRGRLRPSDVHVEDWSDSYTGTAGHSTFLLSAGAPTDSENHPGHLLVPDSDLETRVPVGRICRDPWTMSSQPVTQNAWVATCQTQETSDYPKNWSMSALNIDEAAAAGDATAVTQVPLGEGGGINSMASTAANTLVTAPSSDVDSPITASMVLDPASRTAVPANQSDSMGAAQLGYAVPDYNVTGVTAELRLSSGDGAASLAIPLSSTGAFGPSSVTQDQEGLRFSDDIPAIIPSPGCTVLALTTSGPESHDSAPPHEITIYGVR